jgi:hypothetical protein
MFGLVPMEIQHGRLFFKRSLAIWPLFRAANRQVSMLTVMPFGISLIP